MNNTAFGEVTFDYGFIAKGKLTLWGKVYDIAIRAKAFFEKDGITESQEKAFLACKAGEVEKQAVIERLLKQRQEAATGEPATAQRLREQFSPRTLLFDRGGGYALLVDDATDPDGGLAVCLSPDEKVVTQDEYL